MITFDYYELMFIASCIANQNDRSHYYGIDKTYSRYDTEQKVRKLAELIKDEEYYKDLVKHIKPKNERIICRKIDKIYCDDEVTLGGD